MEESREIYRYGGKKITLVGRFGSRTEGDRRTIAIECHSHRGCAMLTDNGEMLQSVPLPLGRVDSLPETLRERIVDFARRTLRERCERVRSRLRIMTADKNEIVSEDLANYRQSALAASLAGTWSWDVINNVATWDDRFHEIYGFAADAPRCYDTWFGGVHPDDRNLVREQTERLFASDTDIWNQEFRILHPTKGEVWAIALGRVDRDASGRVVKFTGLNLDITDRKLVEAERRQFLETVQALNERLESQVKERTAQLAAINQELEAFSFAIAHDLQTPLRYIRSFADRVAANLRDAPIDPTDLQLLDVVSKSALQTENMVVALLEFSRLGQIEIRAIPVNMNMLVERVLQQLQPEIGQRQIEWRIGSVPNVTGDPLLLELVVQNLLANAVKYTSEREIATIEIGSSLGAGETIFYVKDNGAGFDMKYGERLFTLWQRLHPQSRFRGHGVGLATVRRIVHRHGGRIWASAEIDRGATFSVALPAREICL